MSFIDKAKAIKHSAEDMAVLKKLPTTMKEIINTLIADLKDIKNVVETLRNDLGTFPAKLKECMSKQLQDCTTCYENCYGPI